MLHRKPHSSRHSDRYSNSRTRSAVRTAASTVELLESRQLLSVSFNQGTSYTLGPSYFNGAVVVGDFTGDSIQDVATLDTRLGATTHDLRVLRGIGNGSFVAFHSQTITGAPRGLVAADMDFDGRLDLVTADSGSNGILVMRQQFGGFSAPSKIAMDGVGPSAVAAGSIPYSSFFFGNNSGPGIVAANSTDKTASTLVRKAFDFFSLSKGPSASTGQYAPSDVVLADFNKDGYNDIATSSYVGQRLSVNLYNTTSGKFDAAKTVALGASPYALVAADFNRDGIVDIATGNPAANKVTVLIGKGDGTFTLRGNYSSGLGCGNLAVADFNQDGRLDLVTANFVGNSVTVLEAKTDGSFGSPTHIRVGARAVDVAVGDFNGDSRPDIVAVRVGGLAQARVLLNRSVAVRIDWSMPSRYGLDSNGNGRIDLLNTKEYANPNGFTLNLNASRSQSDLPITSYQWKVWPSGGGSARLASGVVASVPNLPEGKYVVALTLTTSDGVKHYNTEKVTVRDILVVSLGDSYASGEGNPEVAGHAIPNAFVGTQWADGVTDGQTRENAEAHRSTKAASSVAALALEGDSSHYSVTYVSLAQSGATTNNVASDTREGALRTGYPLQPQLKQLKSIVGSRTVDLMTLSIGGNDIGFEGSIIDYLLHNPSQSGWTWTPPSLYYLPETGPALDDIASKASGKIDALSTHYANIASFIKTYGLNVNRVLVTEYPDPTRDDNGNVTSIASDLIDTFPLPALPPGVFVSVDIMVDSGEAQQAYDKILSPLNAKIRSIASNLKWDYVGGIMSAFSRHGYSAGDHWFRRNSEAVSLQGADNIGITINGTLALGISQGALHPNAAGHIAIAGQMLSVMRPAVTSLLSATT